jgi:hypothetical protein
VSFALVPPKEERRRIDERQVVPANKERELDEDERDPWNYVIDQDS